MIDNTLDAKIKNDLYIIFKFYIVKTSTIWKYFKKIEFNMLYIIYQLE